MTGIYSAAAAAPSVSAGGAMLAIIYAAIAVAAGIALLAAAYSMSRNGKKFSY